MTILPKSFLRVTYFTKRQERLWSICFHWNWSTPYTQIVVSKFGRLPCIAWINLCVYGETLVTESSSVLALEYTLHTSNWTPF